MPIGQTLTQKAGPLPVWAWAGLGTAALTGYLLYRKKQAMAAQANQQAGYPNLSSNLGTIPVSNLTTQGQPMPIQMGDTFVSVSNPGSPPPTGGTPQTQLLRVSPTSSTPDWAALAAQPKNVQDYLRALAAQVSKTGGWTTVPAGFQGLPPGFTLQASGPGWVTGVMPGATTPTTIPVPYPNPIQVQSAASGAGTLAPASMPPAPGLSQPATGVIG